LSARPRYRADLRFVEQVYRGEQSYIVKDPVTQKYFRFRPVEALVLQSFDGRTFAEIATALAEEGFRLTAGALEAFARKLAGMGLLERTLTERTTLEVERLRAERSRRRRRPLFRGEVLRMRWSVGDPDGLLTRTLPWLRWCFSPVFLAVSVVLFAAYFWVLAVKWGEFSSAVAALYSPSALTLSTLVILWCTALPIIVIHELGHAYTCKYFGGEVHEMGFMLLYFEPAFYCNVNDAWTFPELRARLWVTAAGSWIQFVIASLAALVWWAAVSGTLVSEIALAAMIIGGVTTILTNMNPLIPLDGYFALSDWLEIPNLRQRASGYFTWAVKRYLLRLDVEEPPATDRERRVFIIYAGLATCYIAGIFVFASALMLGFARQLLGFVGALVVGLLIFRAAWSPIVEWWRNVALSIRAHRAQWQKSPWRIRALAAAVAVLLILLLFPRWITVAGGFIAVPVRSLPLIAPDSGIVKQVYAGEATRVTAGAPVIRIQNLALEQELVARARARDSVAAEETRARAQSREDEAQRLAVERAALTARVDQYDSRLSVLVLRARAAGEVLTARPEQLLGRRVDSGDTLVIVGDADSLDLRIALTGAGATRVQPGSTVSVLPYSAVERPILGVVRSVSPIAGSTPDMPGVEARVRVAAGGPWRVGVTGEARVRLRRSNLLGEIWWDVRQRVRPDILL
jgi:putative peptide zinc metalloprotease protein